MKKLIVGAAVLTCLLGLQTRAATMTLSDPNIAGIVWGQAGDTASMETGFAQHILDLTVAVEKEWWTVDNHYYGTANPGFWGTITSPGTQSAPGATQVPAGWEWVLAKYDGQNGGYVLFHLGGQAFELPPTSADLWLNEASQGYGVSHFTTFNYVPDGGGTLALLGAALCGVAVVRRRLGR